MFSQAEKYEEIEALKAENTKLREIFPKILDALGNGSKCMPDCSLEFLGWIPDEVKKVVIGLKRQIK